MGTPMEYRNLDGTPQPSAVVPQGTWRGEIQAWRARRKVQKAAPDLLAAAQDVLALWDAGERFDPDSSPAWANMEELRAAVAKAEVA